MSDMMEKIGELLSDGESLKQLSELAQMLTSEEGSNDSEQQGSTGDKNESGAGTDGLFSGGFDFSSLMKLQEIMGAVTQKDKNTELLIALKPHLSEERQEKVDKALKLMKMIAVWNILKESGMLGELL